MAKNPKPIRQWKARFNRNVRRSKPTFFDPEKALQDEVGRQLEERMWQSLRRTEVMTPEKRQRLLAAGWTVADTQTFLGLSDQEMAHIDRGIEEKG